MIVLTKDLYDQFAAKELTLKEVEAATQVTPEPEPVEPEPMSDEQFEKESNIAIKKLNQVIGNQAADLRFGMSLNHPAVQKLVTLAKAHGATQEEAENSVLNLLGNTGKYFITEDEEEQPEGIPSYEEFRVPAPCLYWLGII